MSLYKFTHMSLLKNAQLKKKSDKEPTKKMKRKRKSPKFIKKEKSCPGKKRKKVKKKKNHVQLNP